MTSRFGFSSSFATFTFSLLRLSFLSKRL
jgi:hypothetical protein